MSKQTKALCEGAVMVALAVILGMLRLYRLPNGGSITIAILPLVFFAVRNGAGWGFLAGFVYGGLDYIVGHGVAIDWTSIICDYFLAYGLLGLGAGLFKGRKWSACWGTLLGGALMFLSSYPWFYSFLYNIIWAGPDVALTLVIFLILYQVKPMRRLLLAQDLVA